MTRKLKSYMYCDRCGKMVDADSRCPKAETIVAKVKFWFGKDEPIFDKKHYRIEQKDEYAYIYKRKLGRVA